MIRIEIRNPQTGAVEPFEIKTKWNEMTIKDYKSIHRAHIKHQEKLTEEQINEVTLMRYYKDICTVVLNRPMSYVNQIHIEDVTALINGLNEILTEYPYEGVQKFKFEEETYWFPQKLMTGNTFGEYIELSQLELNAKNMKNGRFDIVAEQMARICKTEEEVVNDVVLEEDVVEKRARKFEHLPMDIVWEFCFFLQNPWQSSTKDSQISGEVRQELEKAFKQVKSLKVTDG